MSKATKCDRCGMYCDGESAWVTVTDGYFDPDKYDLCNCCKADFDRFIKGTTANRANDDLRKRREKRRDDILKNI